LEMNVPIGFRRELSGIRHQELLMARERAILQDLELEISHQLGDSIRDIDLNYGLLQTNFNRRVAAEAEVQAMNFSYEAGRVSLDLLLQAQARRAESESAYYRSLVDYNRSIMNVHYRKGSLLDYDGVYLSEGQWPAKAYFDAMRQARKRDAALYMDYGYTRPNVVSQGPVQQGCSPDCKSGTPKEIFGAPDQAMPDGSVPEESLPAPSALPKTAPSANSSSLYEPQTGEGQTPHPFAAVAQDSAIGVREKRCRFSESLPSRSAYNLS
jgi:hypothetical protein